MAHVIMEQTFDSPITDEDLGNFARRLDECLELRQGAWVRSYVAADRKRMICEFDAPDAQSVREALRSTAFACDRVWSADIFAVEDYPEHLRCVAAARSLARANRISGAD
jgi:hypothetical protein